MAEIAGGVLWCESSEGLAKCRLEGNDRTGFKSTQLLLHLSPALFDGVEVGRVGRQVTERSSGLFDEFSDTIHFVSSQIVHDNLLARFQLWAKNLFQIGQEDIAIGGRLNRHYSHPAGNADGSQDSQCAPVAGGNSLFDACAVECAAIAPRHFCRDAAFIDEDELRRVDVPGFSLPEPALRCDTLAVLLGGVE